ncbi:putative phosphoribosyl transferase [subsurface metagenome]
MYSDRGQVAFEDRHDAGRQLAEKLGEYSGQSVVVLAIPNGGVPVALEVASALKADFDVVICRKIPLPLTPEGGFGACADDGTVILNEEVVRRVGLSHQQIENEANKVRAEIKQRSILYQGDRPLIVIRGRTVIIVDDGLASGITMRAAVESVRHRRPKEIVAAAPCASVMALKQVEGVADRVVICATGFVKKFHISDYYQQWYDLSDDEVIRYLNRWRARYFR